MELVVFVRQNVSIRNKIVFFHSELLLSLYKIETEPVFASNFVRHWEMVDSLKLVETFVEK